MADRCVQLFSAWRCCRRSDSPWSIHFIGPFFRVAIIGMCRPCGRHGNAATWRHFPWARPLETSWRRHLLWNKTQHPNVHKVVSFYFYLFLFHLRQLASARGPHQSADTAKNMRHKSICLLGAANLRCRGGTGQIDKISGWGALLPPEFQFTNQRFMYRSSPVTSAAASTSRRLTDVVVVIIVAVDVPATRNEEEQRV